MHKDKDCSRGGLPVHKIIKAQGRRHFHADIIRIPRQIKIYVYFHLLSLGFFFRRANTDYLLLIIILIENPAGSSR